jgi:succinate-semialdehyde dehydrogenase / glutarate-semialdehyde dehydrogenase
MPIQTVNPFTGEVVRRFEEASANDIQKALQQAHASFLDHRHSPFESRSRRMMRTAELLEKNAGEYARLITMEMGKPVTASLAEVRKCATACRYYAENAEQILADIEVANEGRRSFIRHRPLGVVLAVMPWNFPFWQVFRFAAPALMAGNTAILKHASNVPQCALAIESIFHDAGYDAHEFQTLLISAEKVAELLGDRRIAAATLTGSEAAGASLAQAAGRNIKKVVLELGGSDPFIVMPSADIDEAARIAVKARTVNSGQSCIAAKRFIVHRIVAGEFTAKFVAGMKKLVSGDPARGETEIGPLATPQIADEVEKQVNESVAKGAKLLCGGKRGNRNFYEPTVLLDPPHRSAARCDEIFGPVAAVITVDSIEEAISVANETEFGLGSSVWTNDERERQRFIDEIEAGQVFINEMVASDPRLPFGGVKRSGFGRELGHDGIREFVNIKTIVINETASETKKAE